MQRVTVACAAFSFAILASPLSAQQQTVPEQPPPLTQPIPEVPQTTPAVPKSVPPAPPPMPSSRHRWYEMGGHHAATSHPKPAHHASHPHHTTHETHASHAHHATHEHHSATRASKKTIRQCHKMTYQQIMRHSSCRDLMKEDLKSAEHPHHHASHHKGKTHQKAATHHRSTTHRHKS